MIYRDAIIIIKIPFTKYYICKIYHKFKFVVAIKERSNKYYYYDNRTRIRLYDIW